MDLENAFDKVPREVVWWALRCLGVDEWIVLVIKAMYEDATTTVRVNGRVVVVELSLFYEALISKMIGRP